MTAHVPLILEDLAARRWFAEHGEVALTAGLTLCLRKDAAASQAFVKLMRERTGHTEYELPYPERWEAESRDGQAMRIDVSGWIDAEGAPAPVVFVEAKISALFSPRQVSTYVGSQKQGLRTAGRAHGALAVLVPQGRVSVARAEVAADLECLGVKQRAHAWLVDGAPAVAVTVVSWDEALHAMLAVADQASCDLEQLRGACRALLGADVTAFTDADLAGEWQSRKEELCLIVNRVTREAIARLSLPLLPWQPSPSGGLDAGFRYLGLAQAPNLAVGMRLDGASPPLWVRWHPRTADIGLVEARLTAARRPPQRHEGGLWLPLDLQPDSGSASRQIESLVSQVVALYKVAVGSVET